MKKVKRFFAILLAMTMVMGMSMVTFAEGTTAPKSTDTANVTIKNLTGNPTVKLYQILDGSYGDEGIGFRDYVVAKGTDDQQLTGITLSNFVNQPSEMPLSKPTSDTIATAANGIVNGTIKAKLVDESKPNAEGIYTHNVGVGAYIAIITGATDASIYNPIFLTASYGSAAEGDENLGVLVGGTILADSDYLYGATAVAKKTNAGITKEITDGATDDETHQDEDGEDIKTASIGDVLEYTLTPTVPEYPKDAINKTFYISDTMVAGLTLDFSSITININGKKVTGVMSDGIATFTLNNGNGDTRVIAKAKETTNNVGQHGFNLAFDYDELIIDKYDLSIGKITNSTGAIYTPITVTYKAVINKDAVVGGPTGNTNDVTLYYANQPNNGKTYKDPNPENPNENPANATGIGTDTDQKTVYTYRLAFLKTDDAETGAQGLGGAVFGIYKGYTKGTTPEQDQYTGLVDVVTTNEAGYAESTNVAAGDYWLKELVAPKGYSLLADPIKVTASWTSATTTQSSTVTNFVYTTDASESLDGTQAGWLKKASADATTGVFYALDAFVAGTGDNAGKYGVVDDDGNFTEVANVVPAYIKSTNTTTTDRTTVVTNAVGTQGTGVSYHATAIKNTKLSVLPSTGGIGTTIFTIGGCAIMIIAAGLYFASRRKKEV